MSEQESESSTEDEKEIRCHHCILRRRMWPENPHTEGQDGPKKRVRLTKTKERILRRELRKAQLIENEKLRARQSRVKVVWSRARLWSIFMNDLERHLRSGATFDFFDRRAEREEISILMRMDIFDDDEKKEEEIKSDDGKVEVVDPPIEVNKKEENEESENNSESTTSTITEGRPILSKAKKRKLRKLKGKTPEEPKVTEAAATPTIQEINISFFVNFNEKILQSFIPPGPNDASENSRIFTPLFELLSIITRIETVNRLEFNRKVTRFPQTMEALGASIPKCEQMCDLIKKLAFAYFRCKPPYTFHTFETFFRSFQTVVVSKGKACEVAASFDRNTAEYKLHLNVKILVQIFIKMIYTNIRAFADFHGIRIRYPADVVVRYVTAEIHEFDLDKMGKDLVAFKDTK